MRSKLLLFFLVGILYTTMAWAQVEGPGYQSQKIIPPSPTAAALGSYGNTSVNFYNGTPNISIPLYDISTSNHSLKVSLSYDASGTKVAQDASWVGLGWSLSAGGVVSRIIRQGDDFGSHGYYIAAAIPTSADMNTSLGKNYCNDVYKGYLDAEPDIYSYNFNGFSGRFVLGKKADGAPVFLDEKNNLDIRYVNGGWVFTTGEGYKYYFSAIERAQDYYWSAGFEMPSLTGITGLNMSLDDILPATGWYLDSIVAPTSEAIRFNYVKGKSLSLVNKSETFCMLDRITYFSCVGGAASPNLPGSYHSYGVSRQVLSDIYLQKITFSNGSIEFNTSPRSDIEYLSSPDSLLTPSKLDNINIKKADGTLLKKFSFYYSYFNSEDVNGRLKLDSIAETGAMQQWKPPYSFTYINPTSLPDKKSKSIDHWGYYNGKSNYTLLPTTAIPEASQSFTGADRNADTVNVYPANGVLSVITYPTGGSTQFEYELNDYGNLRGDQRYVTVDRFASVRSNHDIHPQDDEVAATFTILPDPDHPNDKIPVTITCSYQKVNPNVSDLVSLGYSNMWQILPNGQQQAVAGCTSANYDQPNPSPTESNRNFDPGTYHMLVQSTSGWSFYMGISWKEKVPIIEDQRKGGGIRIKSITDLDAYGHQTVRKYLYKDNDGKTSGLLLGYPKYDANYEASQFIYIPAGGEYPGGICSVTGFYTQITSGSLYPSGLSSKSGIVGYSKITELLGSNGENGKTEYYFSNTEETVDDFPGIPTTANPLNGKLDSMITYNNSGDRLKKTAYGYEVKESNSARAIKLFTSPILQGDGNLANDINYFVRFYGNNSSWTVPVSEKDTIYDGNKIINTSKSYSYDNNTHRERTRMEEDKSDGSLHITKYLRPADFNAAGSNAFVTKMISQHNITPIIEQQEFVQRGGTTKLLSGTFTNYKSYGTGFYKPDVIYKTEIANPINGLSATTFQSNGQVTLDANYKPQIYFDTYNNLGGVQSLHKANDVSETYLWGYQSQFPVAKIVGADYNTVKQFITQSILDNPSSDQQLREHLANLRLHFPTANISYYTYNPLTGMTSETDASGKTSYYEYDSFGRLLLIKDQNGKILKQFDYQYQKPVTQ